VTERSAAQRIMEQLHATRVAGDLNGMCQLFADRGRFEILGASADKPIAIQAVDLPAFRVWLSMLVKVYRLKNYRLLSVTIELPRVVAHWRADITSKVTGMTIATDLVDLTEIADGKIISYTEFFAPRG
jgi:ketosteroid isomerase-like protein